MTSPLARRVRSEATPEELSARQRHVALRAYREAGVVAIRLDDPRLDDWERQTVRNLAAKLYGVA